MKNVLSYVVLITCSVCVFIGCGLLLVLADNDNIGLLGYPFLAVAYIGYYLALKWWKGPELRRQGGYQFFIKYAFIYHLVFGIIFLVSFISDYQNRDFNEPLYIPGLQQGTQQEIIYNKYTAEMRTKSVLGWIVGISLIAPFCLRQLYYALQATPHREENILPLSNEETKEKDKESFKD